MVDVPIIGTGGISSGIDAAEMIMAGAALVGVGSALVNGGPAVFGKINTELQEFMRSQGYQDLESMRGLVHRRANDTV